MVSNETSAVLGAVFLLLLMGMWTVYDFIVIYPSRKAQEDLARDLEQVSKERRK